MVDIIMDESGPHESTDDLGGVPQRVSIMAKEKEKLPIHLCRKPNRQNMSEEEYEDSIRELIQNRVCLDEEERLIFANVVRQGIPEGVRAEFWNLCTGLYMYKHGYCKDYYKTLREALGSGMLEEYPNQMFEKYKRDISRAFPNDTFYTEEIKASISRVIEAYIWRNPTVGYIQGFNFLVFRLRKVLNEEDTFWTLVMIIETYMPPDYYVEMYGVRTQASILQKIFRQYSFLPDVQAKFDDPAIQFNLMDNAISWFISLYTECLPERASLQVLDLFFLNGQKNNKVIFDVALGYLRTLSGQIVAADDLGVLKNEVFTENNETLKNADLLMEEILGSCNALKQEHIDFYRPVCQKEAVDHAQEIKFSAYTMFKKVREEYKKGEQEQKLTDKIRRQFLQMFTMFEGDIRDRMKNSYRDPVNTFKCDPKWPMCAYNFSKRHVIPEGFVFKSGDYDQILLFPNYFSQDAIENQVQKTEEASTLTNIVIERDYHYCRPHLFKNTFASLYVNKLKQQRLFKCKHLAIKKNMTQIESHRKMTKFVNFIVDQRLSDRERIRMEPRNIIQEDQPRVYHEVPREEEESKRQEVHMQIPTSEPEIVSEPVQESSGDQPAQQSAQMQLQEDGSSSDD